MSWRGVGDFFGKEWVRKQSPVVVFSIIILFMLYRLIFVSLPKERESDRELLTALTTLSNTNMTLAVKEFRDECKDQRDFAEKRYLVQDQKYDRLIEKVLKIENNNNNILGDFDKDKFMRETREAVIRLKEKENENLQRNQRGHSGAGYDHLSADDNSAGGSSTASSIATGSEPSADSENAISDGEVTAPTPLLEAPDGPDN